CQQYDNWNSF
nr:immunoglobulin light chain junction region [Macaca mulatta]MOX07406.1 immunoglobulin light chain junction region [Macaca mulatta]MOX07875.1 immunoglobulin light chain junction region [Macaca mulatta]MOX07883.1 immunoglobulin light chain junction region [Macaca mulatta]MOX08210.1 immunoglobulin light chain junction region [Macaca mulatta]